MPPRLVVCPSCANLARPSEDRCPVERAPDRPYDFGRLEIVEEPWI